MSDSDADTVLRERDLYLRLLDLGDQTELTPFLREALALVVDVTGAHQGYLELQDGDGPTWSMASGFTEEEIRGVQTAISRGIIAEAIATGKTIMTPAALLDPRFNERESIQGSNVGAVLCAPIGTDQPGGVLYLHGPLGTSFSERASATARVFTRHLTPLADRLLVRRRVAPDATAPFRATLRLDGIVGRSAALADTLKHVALLAPLDTTVLLTGESGTGKSQIARIIHDNGPRAAHRFVELNCAALPETLLENELFGAAAGAHSTATRRIEGKVATAQHGTLFLDEIGQLTLSAQAKLLHLLHTRDYYPLGAAKPVHADVRVIAASNIDLAAAVADGHFREDLLYRLHVLPIRLPTLAERRTDVEPLAAHFCALACERHRLPKLALSRNALRALEAAAWPGHVRQLAHAVEASAIRAAGEGSTQIEEAHVFPNAPPADTADPAAPLTFQTATRRFQERFLREAIEDADWNLTEVARRLDIARSHVYNLIRAFGLTRNEN